MTHPQQPTRPTADPSPEVARTRAPTPLGTALRRLADECDRAGITSDRCHVDPQTGNLVVECEGVERV